MSEQETITEALRQLRDEVDRLFTEAQVKLREAQAANSRLRAAMLVMYPTETSDDDGET